MSDQDRTEPRVWAMPEEPPVGTVVIACDDGARYRRVSDAAHWQPEAGEAAALADRMWVGLLMAGPVTEVLPTPAEVLAERLANVARHLRAHPELEQVTVSRDDMHISTGDRPAAALLAWAQSMGDVSMAEFALDVEAGV